MDVLDSSSQNTGGGIALQDAEATLLGVRVIGSTAIHAGGGIALIGSYVEAENLWISDNTVNFLSTCKGGGITVNTGSELTVTGGVIAGNICETTSVSGDIRGAAGNQESSEVTLTNVSIVGNQGITRSNTVSCVGWYYTSDIGHPLRVTNTSSTDNTAPGALSVGAGAWLLGGVEPAATFAYSNAADNDGPDFVYVDDPTGTGGNLAVSAGYTSTSAEDAEDWDLTLAQGSSLIDAGDPAILDPDGGRSDIGALGGPTGASW